MKTVYPLPVFFAAIRIQFDALLLVVVGHWFDVGILLDGQLFIGACAMCWHGEEKQETMQEIFTYTVLVDGQLRFCAALPVCLPVCWPFLP